MIIGAKGRAGISEGWLLQGRDGNGRAVRLPFRENELAEADFGLTVGRHPGICHRVIDDPSVSRRHLRLTLRNGKLCIEDLNSLNGSVLDGRLLEPFEPAEGSEGQDLILGAVALRIEELAD